MWGQDGAEPLSWKSFEKKVDLVKITAVIGVALALEVAGLGQIMSGVLNC
jgi:hypothetical protein